MLSRLATARQRGFVKTTLCLPVLIVFATSMLGQIKDAGIQNPAKASSGRSNENEVVIIHTGFITGQKFRDLSELQKRSYAAGMLDGMLLAPLFGAAKERTGWFEACVTGMSDEQLAAILSKYLSDNPTRWHESVHLLFYSALHSTCP